MIEPTVLSNKCYEYICKMIWGCIPISKNNGKIKVTKQDNMDSSLFKENKERLIKQFYANKN